VSAKSDLPAALLSQKTQARPKDPEGHGDGHPVLLLRRHRYTGTVSSFLCWTPDPRLRRPDATVTIYNCRN
jgi:hypothetical protein